MGQVIDEGQPYQKDIAINQTYTVPSTSPTGSLQGFTNWGSRQISNDRNVVAYSYWYHTHPFQQGTPVAANPGAVYGNPNVPSGNDASVSATLGLRGIIVSRTRVVVFDSSGNILCGSGDKLHGELSKHAGNYPNLYDRRACESKYQCSRHSEEVNLQSNSATQSASPSSSIEKDVKGRKALQGQIEIIQGAIKRESLNLKINNLKDAGSEAETEIRIWIGFGMLYPRCFIMKELNERREAFFIAPKIKDTKTGGKVSMTKLSLEPPKSGWNEFTEFIKNQGIDYPMKLSFDDQYVPDPDEESIAIEVKSHGDYEVVFYTLSTKSEDGRKALEVCRKIEQEFGIRMGCAEVR